MNQIEELKNKIQKLVNQYNFGNYKLVSTLSTSKSYIYGGKY